MSWPVSIVVVRFENIALVPFDNRNPAGPMLFVLPSRLPNAVTATSPSNAARTPEIQTIPMNGTRFCGSALCTTTWLIAERGTKQSHNRPRQLAASNRSLIGCFRANVARRGPLKDRIEMSKKSKGKKAEKKASKKLKKILKKEKKGSKVDRSDVPLPSPFST